jgi:unsaturated chondroitin disaccharide hydrolase
MIALYTDPASELQPKLRQAFDFGQQQVRRLIEGYPDQFPVYTQKGRWSPEGEAWTHWCEGFLGGMMWIFYEETGDPFWGKQAEHYSRLIEHRKDDRSVHDLGFLFLSTYGRWHRLEADPKLNEILVHAGRTLAMRFREKGGYLCSFVAPESLFIDIMMNVGIIFYAAEQSGDEALLDIAIRHSLTTRRFLVRGDGSTAHEGIFDLDTGEFLRQTTHQGYRGDSCWSRGLTWALYGFGTVYGYSQEEKFLKTAEACADFFLENTPENGVPPWDYDAPQERRLLVDSSAAAIAASGLLQLYGLVMDSDRRQKYLGSALRILDTLASPEYLAINDPDWEGILKHAVYHIHRGLGVDESVMWGEYFFLEAVQKALRCGNVLDTESSGSHGVHGEPQSDTR